VIRRLLIVPLLCLTPFAFADQRPILSLVIDDLGYSYQRGQDAINLQGDHTYAIIPGATYSQKLARLAQQKDKEIILHLPLQASSSLAPMEPNALNEKMDEDQITSNLQSMLSAFDNIKGVNNHMGSHLTAIDYFMRPIMDSIKSYNPRLYFLDSRTTALSVAQTEALSSGIDSISRDVFLDNDATNVESIRLQFQIWLQKARERGSAIAIGHPHETTINFLRDNLSQTGEQFKFISVSKLIEVVYNSEDAYSAQEDPEEPLSKLN
jgi:polysaccharide deacetylase 2 family uncharacterized protein YibQ